MTARKKAPLKLRVAVPKEDAEQMAVVRWLRMRPNILFTHCPNGGKRSLQWAVKLKAMGVTAGIPDLLIFAMHANIALELKRTRGGNVTAEQKAWLDGLAARGWKVNVCRGANDAIAWLMQCGI